MLDYDLEAARYDETRGGLERAEAAAAALSELVPADAAVLVDVACGTGIVSELLKRPGRMVIGVDYSAGMLALARPRLNAVARGDATRLPIAAGVADAVTFMWLLHLVDAPVVEAAIGEAARVLRPGGVLVTSVDKNSAAFSTASDVGALLQAARRDLAPEPTDSFELVRAIAAEAGLEFAATAGYVGHGQGRTPQAWAHAVRERLSWSRNADPEAIAELCRQLAALPDQDVERPDPVYTLAAFRRRASSSTVEGVRRRAQRVRADDCG
ncbi:MAG: class I SAM-dependent methyltransferase [Catenulispora sp.]|nr:class I SAM-dependent methyltransferase [Catenulispora sp.]